MNKRTWIYSQHPTVYDISGCTQCHGNDIEWSEFENYIWCKKCLIDYIPDSYGMFDGPIPIRVASMMGVKFNRICLITHQLHIYDIENGQYYVLPP